MMHAAGMFVRWKLWKHDCLFFPSTRLALIMTNVFLAYGQLLTLGWFHRQTDGLCGACQDLLKSKYTDTLGHTTVNCNIFHLILIKRLCAGTETFEFILNIFIHNSCMYFKNLF